MAFNRKNLIISADDFGISQLANDNILLLAEAGKLDRVAIMTNGIFSPEEIIRLKKSGVKLDIHLDLDHAISPKRKLKDGVLLRAIIFFSKYLKDYINADSKKILWQEQLKKFHSIFGKYPDGINSHQHVHFFPGYFKIIIRLSQKNNIPFVRFGKKWLIQSNSKVYRILNWLHKMDLKFFLASALGSSDFMLSLDWSRDIHKTLKQLPDGITEVVCHPERPEEFEFIKKHF